MHVTDSKIYIFWFILKKGTCLSVPIILTISFIVQFLVLRPLPFKPIIFFSFSLQYNIKASPPIPVDIGSTTKVKAFLNTILVLCTPPHFHRHSKNFEHNWIFGPNEEISEVFRPNDKKLRTCFKWHKHDVSMKGNWLLNFVSNLIFVFYFKQILKFPTIFYIFAIFFSSWFIFDFWKIMLTFKNSR